MIIGGIAIAVGTFAIVATAGAATPLVVTAVAHGAGQINTPIKVKALEDIGILKNIEG